MLRATVFSRCYVFGRALRRVFFRIVYFSLSLCFDNHFSFNFNVSLFFVYCLCFCSNAPSRFDELTDAMLCRPLGDKPLKPIASAVMWIVLPLRFVFFFFASINDFAFITNVVTHQIQWIFTWFFVVVVSMRFYGNHRGKPIWQNNAAANMLSIFHSVCIVRERERNDNFLRVTINTTNHSIGISREFQRMFRILFQMPFRGKELRVALIITDAVCIWMCVCGSYCCVRRVCLYMFNVKSIGSAIICWDASR